MSISFWEVAGVNLFNMKMVSLVFFFIFAIICIGYLVGKINVKGVTLGTAAIFLVALVAGHFKGVTIGYSGHEGCVEGWAASVGSIDTYFKLIQNTSQV